MGMISKMYIDLLSRYLYGVRQHRGKGLLVSLVTAGRPVFTARSRYGALLRGSWKDATFRSSVIGKYDDVYRELDELAPGMAFLDIGANAGIFSLVASPRVGNAGVVVAFEPSQKNFARLVDAIERNGAANIHAWRCAVGSACGMTGFAQGPDSHSGISRLDPNAASHQVFILGGKELDCILETLVADRRTIIKIDVEGAEHLVLKGIGESFLSSKRIEKLVVEIDEKALSRFGSTPADVYAFLQGCGFTGRKVAVGHHYNEVFTRAPSRG